MNKLGASDLLSYVCENIPKSKRFSTLSQLELASVWRDTTAYICQQVTNKKSVNFPGVGAFYMKKVKSVSVTGDTADTSVPCFVPAKSWEKVPGYKVPTSNVTGSNSAEPMNFAAVAGLSGFSRDDVEPGLRDIVHALFLVLKRGSNISLLFADMGRLVFQNREIKFCFTADFLELIATGLYRAPEIKEKQKPTTAPAAVSSTSNSKEAHEYIPEEISGDNVTRTTASEEPQQSQQQDAKAFTTNQQGSQPQQPAAAPKDPKQEELEEIERLAILLTTRGDTHTHPHADNRLWSDAKCPICRQKSQVVVDVKDKLTEREKTQDKMLLLLSLEVDREYLKQTREVELKKVKAAIGTAIYNHAEALEK
ncbi:UNVERIFIED_CONTAM: Coiled-coil domain-containing protein 81, partial [Siphonaria sp. JEL0065]